MKKFEKKIFEIKPELKEDYEIFCPVCDGHSLIYINGYYKFCKKCFGLGKIDWSSNVIKNEATVTFNGVRLKDKESEVEIVSVNNFCKTKIKDKFLTKNGLYRYKINLQRFLNRKINSYLHEISKGFECYYLFHPKENKFRINVTINSQDFLVSCFWFKKFVKVKFKRI